MILVTGANGFIGRALIDQLKAQGYGVRGSLRARPPNDTQSEFIRVSSLDGDTDWSQALRSCKAVIHLAALAHNSTDKARSDEDRYFKHNCEAAVNLACQAEKAGVKRFVFLSSTGVMGPQVTSGVPYTLDTTLAPHDPYTKSKALAEQKLVQLSREFAMEVTILRAPVVYGPSAPGSIGSLIRAIRWGIPLPLGGLYNRRNLVSIGNLVDLIVSCISSKASASGVYIASDGETLSTSDICYLCGHFAGARPRLISIPPWLLMLIARMLGKQKLVTTLLGDFELDASTTSAHFNWSPSYSPTKHVLQIKNGIRT